MSNPRLPVLAFTAALIASILAAVRADAATTFIKGVDVYSGEGTITWSSVKAGGYDFAFVKATEGVNFIDTKFTANMTGAHNAGLYVGPYHFAHPESKNGVAWPTTYDGQALSPTATNQLNRDAYADATSEASDFITAVRPYYHQTGATKYLRPVADVELSKIPHFQTTALDKTFVSNWIQLFSDAVLAELGVRPFMYLSKSNANTYWTSTIASSHPFWLAQYKGTGTTSPPVQSDTPLWPAWSFWQWSDGTDAIAQGDLVPGISNSPDRDVYSGTLASLANFRVQIANGDADFNGRVNADDYFRIDAGYARHATGWANGDFNWNGVINGDDYAIIDAAYTSSPHAPLPTDGATAVPEPATCALLGIGIAMLARRRKSGQQ